MSFYFKRVFAALQFQVGYGRQPDSVRGIIGQYRLLTDGLGLALVLLFGVALLWACWYIVKHNRANEIERASRSGVFAILLLSILVLDLPIMISYLYQLRFFLTMLPFFAILAAFFVEDLYRRAKRNGTIYSTLVGAGVTLIVIYSIARILSLMLMFINDARIPASAFMKRLPEGSSLEYTFYSPTIPLDYFKREHNYPIYFRKAGDEPLPTNKYYVFNIGESGLDERATDYLVVDSFTTDKFQNPYTCADMQVECDFFKQLATGQSVHYKLIKEFSYILPAYLPQIKIAFVNPSIRVYERIK